MRWKGRHKADSCLIPDIGFGKLQDWMENEQLSQAIGIHKPNLDNNAIQFLKFKKIRLEKDSYYSKYYEGIPSLLNKDNDCYFFRPTMNYFIQKSIVGEFARYNLLIDGFLTDKIKKKKGKKKK
jgi:hypothetical protein